MASALSSGPRSGVDPAGLVFGHAYQQSAQALLEAGAAAVNAGRGIGFGVQMSATNYSRADAASTVGGGASTLAPPEKPADFGTPAAPTALGGGVPPPLLWSVIETFIPDVWPDGDPSALRATASAWQTFASTVNSIAGGLLGPTGVIGGQQIPEGGDMTSAISELSQSLSGIASEAAKLATQTREFADDVENTQNAIRDLLDRVSPSGLLDGLKAVFSGDALDELKEVADDIKTVLGGYGRQAEARRDMLQIAMGYIDDAIVSVEKWARREFPRYLGDDVGNALATALDFQLTLRQGFLAGGVDLVDGLGQLDPTRFAYDPEGAKAAWSGLAEDLGKALLYSTPTGVAGDPVGAFNHYKGKVEDAVHAEDWSSDRPGYGPGKILFDVGLSAIPGGAATRGTKAAADAAGDAAQAARRVDGVPGNAFDNVASVNQAADNITDKLDDLGDIATGPAAAAPDGPRIPPSLADANGPSAPKLPDSPGVAVPDSPTVDRTPTAPVTSAPDDNLQSHAGAGPGDGARNSMPAPIGATADTRVPSSADAPSTPHQSAPAPAANAVPAGGISPAPPMAAHAPEPAPVAAHSPSSASAPAHALEAAAPSGHAPASTTPDTYPSADSPTGSDHSSDRLDTSETREQQAPAHSNESDEPSSAGSETRTHDPGLTADQRNEILATEKGNRPDPSEYLSPEYIREHLQLFEDGASRFMTTDNLRDYGIGQRDGTTFVFPTRELEALMSATGGDRNALERALGLPEGYFQDYDVVRVDIPDPGNYDLRIPSGNEAGANDQWIPGGLLPKGMPEAVIDGADVPPDDYTVTELPDD